MSLLKSKHLFAFVVSTVVTLPAFGANLSRLVVVGDSLSAGVENFSLLDTQQIHGYASLIAQQAGVPLTLPLVPYPGAPNVLQLKSFGPPPEVGPAQGTLLFPRDNPLVEPFNVSVPGVTLHQGLTMTPTLDPKASPVQQWATIVLGFPNLLFGKALTEIQLAQQLHPTTVIEALGNNDALVPALTGDLSALTPVGSSTSACSSASPSFTCDYNTVLSELSKTGATLIVTTIPDVTKVAFFMSVQTIAEQIGEPAEFVESRLDIGPNDYVRITAEPYLDQIFTGQLAALPTDCPSPLAALTPNPIPCVLSAEGASQLRSTIDSYNSVIKSAALKYNATVVDLNKLVNTIYTQGYDAIGHHLTANFLGGLYSLDGVHPTNTGYAVIANQFINTMNSQLHTNIPPVNVDAVAAQDPLVFPSILSPAHGQ
jgi:phospholipase/lecithinase/hemolysin